MKTALMVILTAIFAGVCVARFVRPDAVPFEVLIWGGLILILTWWGHDVIHEREGKGRYADRTHKVV